MSLPKEHAMLREGEALGWAPRVMINWFQALNLWEKILVSGAPPRVPQRKGS